MKAFGIREIRTVKAFLLSLLGLRMVEAVHRRTTYKMIIIGVPPWRALRSSDLYDKNYIEINDYRDK